MGLIQRQNEAPDLSRRLTYRGLSYHGSFMTGLVTAKAKSFNHFNSSVSKSRLRSVTSLRYRRSSASKANFSVSNPSTWSFQPVVRFWLDLSISLAISGLSFKRFEFI